MTIGGVIKKVAPSYVRNYVAGINTRLARLEATQARVNGLLEYISQLETTVDTVTATPRYEPADDVGFNGQRERKRIFTDLLAAFRFDAIIETGTWLGNTTGFMAETSRLPIFTGELSHRYFTIARKRLVDFPGITLRNSDSRKFLGDLSREESMTARNTFFYLDAHWYNDLPLAEEIDLIARRWREFVIMVDDFEVPGDGGYGYDDYGPGMALTPDYIAPLLTSHGLESWYPAASSSTETGSLRGCVVISRRGAQTEALRRIASLRAG